MTAPRIAAVTYDFYPFDIRVRRMAEAAVDGGFEMHVICLRQPGEAREEVCAGVHVHRLPLGRGFGQSLPVTVAGWAWFTLLASAVLTRQHLRQRYDVVIAHNMPDFLVYAGLLPKLFGAKLVLDVQDVSPELMAAKASGRKRALLFRLAAWQERAATWVSDQVITVGWPFEERLLARGVRPRKLSLILNSADPKLFPAARQEPAPWLTATDRAARPFTLMYYGTLAERNGMATAIRALALARRTVPQVRLDIMGRGEEVPALKRLAEDLGVGDAVAFNDPCPSERIVDFVLHGDVGIIPYHRDGFADLVLPTKAYEMAWMRRPIIASDTAAIRSMFRPGAALLCDPDRPETFADAIVELYQHPERQAAMVEQAAEDYQAYRWELMRERYQSLLAGLARRTVDPTPQPPPPHAGEGEPDALLTPAAERVGAFGERPAPLG
ncbi:MAG TPA: glycosyltransferase family 4 protein [Ktedonobacterales bacterium]|jgi:glycosyltransferase involved in cell wall biosynthesis